MIVLKKLILIIIGILLSSTGLTFIILDLNLLIINYSFLEYFIYIFTHSSTLSFFIGLLLIVYEITLKKRVKQNVNNVSY